MQNGSALFGPTPPQKNHQLFSIKEPEPVLLPQLLTVSCTWIVTNEAREQTWSWHKFPKVVNIITTRVDYVMQATICEKYRQGAITDPNINVHDSIMWYENKEASSTAMELIG
jgi:predicted ATPase